MRDLPPPIAAHIPDPGDSRRPASVWDGRRSRGCRDTSRSSAGCPRIDGAWLQDDAIAALSVWALLVPQALAYATLAGVPVQYGLYTAFAALIAYALFGTARQVVQGPSATVAAVSTAVISPLVGAAALGTDEAALWAAAAGVGRWGHLPRARGPADGMGLQFPVQGGARRVHPRVRDRHRDPAVREAARCRRRRRQLRRAAGRDGRRDPEHRPDHPGRGLRARWPCCSACDTCARAGHERLSL